MLPFGCFGADMGKLFSKSNKSKQDLYASKYAYHGDDDEEDDDEASSDFKVYSPIHSDAVTSILAASADSSLCLTGCKDQSVRLFDFAHGELTAKWSGHEKEVTAVEYASNTESFFSASRDKTINVWKRGQSDPVLTFRGHDLVVSGLSLNPDGRLIASGSRDNSLRIWDVSSGQQLQQNTISRNLITHIKWDKTSNLIAQSGEDKEFRVFDASSLQVAHTFPQKQYIQTCCDIQDNYCLTSSNGFGGNGCECTLWDLRTNSLVCEYVGHTETVGCCMFIPTSVAGGRKLVASSSNDCSLRLWDQLTKECVAVADLPGSGPLSSMTVYNDGSLCVGSFHSGVYVLKISVTSSGVTLLKKAQF